MPTDDIVLETARFRLVLGTDARARSLRRLPDGEECLAPNAALPFFAVTQERPFHNEDKLEHPHRRTSYPARAIRREGDTLVVSFERTDYEAVVSVRQADAYLAFAVREFRVPEGACVLQMDWPPVSAFRLVQLALRERTHFGEWLNVSHDARTAVCVLAADPRALVSSALLGRVRTLAADTHREIGLERAAAALVVNRPDALLDDIAALERDFALPRGVESRRDPILNASAYWTPDLWAGNVEEHIRRARQGGFRLMLVYYPAFFHERHGYGLTGNYDFNDHYPHGLADVKAVLDRVREAGITPGFHFLQTHIGLESRYVTPVADPRLHLRDRFTLAAPISSTDTVLTVWENPAVAPRYEKHRLLRFGGELIAYESVSTERPYRFLGCRRGACGTHIVPHPAGEIGGVLDVCEYGAVSCYADYRTDLPDEIADKLAAVYNAGFSFLYFDGAEGTNPPYDFHTPDAQRRLWEKLSPAPRFAVGAAKSHFSWHMLSGGNAFDIFPTPVLKENIRRHPATEAERLRNDFTRVDFGWLGLPLDLQPDHVEYATSRAAAWDSPVTIQMDLQRLREHPRTDDLLETFRRWEEARATGVLTPARKKALRNLAIEHHLLVNERGALELVPWHPLDVTAPGLRAFLFRRRGKTFVALWHETGRARLDLPLPADRLIVRRHLRDDPIPLRASDSATTSWDLADRIYLSTDLPETTVAEAFRRATLSPLPPASHNTTRAEIRSTLRALGVRPGALVLFHSSLKSLGHVDGGADAVIDAFLDAVGPKGTVAVPTLSQKNFAHAYEEWTLDRPSDTGLITETFRLRPTAVRSDQATHSVAAIGPKAAWLTAHHATGKPRVGAFGPTAFSYESPWQKLRDANATIVFVGVSTLCNTLKHLIEYELVERVLARTTDPDARQRKLDALLLHERWEKGGIWPFYDALALQTEVEKAGILRRAFCHSTECLAFRAKDYCDFVAARLAAAPETYFSPAVAAWLVKNE